MSKNIKLNDTNYNAVSTVQLPTTDGGTASFKDVDEITTPSGSITITENGTHDVTNYASAVVNVPTSGGSASTENTYEMGTFEITETCRHYTYNHNLGRVPHFAIVYPISVGITEQAYAISTELIIRDLGQEDFNICSKEGATLERPMALWYGIGYAATVVGHGSGTCTARTIYTAAELTETYARVGAYNDETNGSGFLVAGTYGIIVG